MSVMSELLRHIAPDVGGILSVDASVSMKFISFHKHYSQDKRYDLFWCFKLTYSLSVLSVGSGLESKQAALSGFLFPQANRLKMKVIPLMLIVDINIAYVILGSATFHY